MIELIMLLILGKKIGEVAADRGYQAKQGRYRWLLVISWFGGEIIGILAGFIFSHNFFIYYPLGLVGAGIGAWIAFAAVTRLPIQESRKTKTDGGDLSWSQWNCPQCGAANTRYDRVKCFQCGAPRPGENPDTHRE